MELVEDGIEYFKVNSNYELLISKCGKVRSTRTSNNTEMVPSLNRKGYLKVNGYFRKKRTVFRVHRLLALAFIPVPDRLKDIPLSELQVNHIDGVKTNNKLSNLEWMTGHENSKHAHKTFLYSLSKEVLARNILDNTILRFNSLSSCAAHFKTERKKLSKHLKSHYAGKITKNWYVFKFNDNMPWPLIDKNDFVESKWEYNSVIFAKDVLTGKEYIFDDISQIYAFLNISTTDVGNKRIKGNSFNIKTKGIYWHCKKFDSIINLNLELVYKDYKKSYYAGKKVKAFNVLTNKETIYETLAIACVRAGFSEATLRKIINNAEQRNNVIYSWL